MITFLREEISLYTSCVVRTYEEKTLTLYQLKMRDFLYLFQTISKKLILYLRPDFSQELTFNFPPGVTTGLRIVHLPETSLNY